MKEIEVKILEIDVKASRKKLDAFAEKISDRVLLTTMTFSNPYNNATVRARIIGNETLFTVKVPVPDREFKIQREYETQVGDFKTLRKQLEALGFTPAMLQEKMRTTYTYRHSEIVIDEYPKIPPYIEIQGAKEEIADIVGKLGRDMEDTTKESVYALFKRYGVDAARLIF
ncbi:MAG: class IV adenylate cyclase [Deltaproteobacteria bacterium]|nr:class IV adenylate cyclase [Deltaproteobacteria bacterium]